MVAHMTKSDEYFLTDEEQNMLRQLHNNYPEAMTTNADDRLLVDAFLKSKTRIAPPVRRALTEALNDAVSIVAPITPPTDYELIAYCDENPRLRVRSDVALPVPGFTPGRTYGVRVKTFYFK